MTEASGIATRGYGQGVASGDIDNDGWPDLYLTGFGRNQMFRNDRDGTFTDVSAASGTGSPDTWGVSAPSSMPTATAGWTCSSATT